MPTFYSFPKSLRYDPNDWFNDMMRYDFGYKAVEKVTLPNPPKYSKCNGYLESNCVCGTSGRLKAYEVPHLY